MFTIAHTARPAARVAMALSTVAHRATAAILAHGARPAIRVSIDAAGNVTLEVALPAEYVDGRLYRRCVVRMVQDGGQRPPLSPRPSWTMTIAPRVDDEAHLHALARTFLALDLGETNTDDETGAAVRHARLALLRALAPGAGR
jgi:hypothetical protein